jgi:hypothetical protein
LYTDLAGQHFDGTLAVAATDTLIVEIDPFDDTPIAWKVYDMGPGTFGKSLMHHGAEGLIVGEGHDHPRKLDRRVFNSELKLFKPTFVFAYIDLIVVVPKVHITSTQEFPAA